MERMDLGRPWKESEDVSLSRFEDQNSLDLAAAKHAQKERTPLRKTLEKNRRQKNPSQSSPRGRDRGSPRCDSPRRVLGGAG